MKISATLVHLLGVCAAAVRAQSCYFPNGTTISSTSDFAPCPNDPLRTICCGLNRRLPSGGARGEDGSPVRDVCLDNGLCMNNHTDSGTVFTVYWINFCTNKDVSDPECLGVCPRTDDGNSRMTPCDGTPTSERWCCGASNSCCEDRSQVVELPAKFRASMASSSMQASTSQTSSSQTSSATSSPSSSSSSSSNEPRESGGLSTGAKIGIAVGAVVGALLLAVALFFMLRARKWKKQLDAAGGQYNTTPHMDNNNLVDVKYGFYAAPQVGINEMDSGKSDPVELSVEARPPAELPSGRY